jgi:DNA adenine methylase
VLCAKPRSKVEVVNDINANLVNFLLIAQQNPEELAQRLVLPYSRWLWRKWKSEPLPEDPMERAIRWFYIMRGSFSGKLTSWRSGRKKNCARDYLGAIRRIKDFSERLQGVIIECLDFRECIRRYDGPDTLFYCDPPYVGAPKDYYGLTFTEQDHRNLAELLHNIQGKVVLSYAPHPLVYELYRGWRMESKEVPCHSEGITRAHPRQTRRKMTELLIMNF